MKKMITWLATTRLLAIPREFFGKGMIKLISRNNAFVVHYYNPERMEVLKMVRDVKKESDMLLEDPEACQIFMGVKKSRKVAGAMVEVGVFKGASAKIICEAKGVVRHCIYLILLKGFLICQTKMIQNNFTRDNFFPLLVKYVNT